MQVANILQYDRIQGFHALQTIIHFYVSLNLYKNYIFHRNKFFF